MNDNILIIKSDNICAKGRHPEDILSNRCNNDFCFEDVQCSSMESFLQSLKYRDAVLQAKICLVDANYLRPYDTSDWQKDQVLWWKGEPVHRQSLKYIRLIYKAYNELYLWCGRFRDALMGSIGKELLYDTGSNDIHQSVLTDNEFIRILSKLRERRKREYKLKIYPRLWPNWYGVNEDYE